MMLDGKRCPRLWRTTEDNDQAAGPGCEAFAWDVGELDNHRGSTACGTTRAMKSPTYTQIACELRLLYVQLSQICRRAPLRCSHLPEVTLTHVR
jgi:hypothetical protein